MAKRKAQKGKRPYRKRGFKHWPRGWMVAAVFGATLCVTLLSFISIPLGMLGLGLFGVLGMIETEAYDRSLWEQSASFKFKTLKDNQDALAKEILANSRDVDALREEVADRSKHVPKEPLPSPPRPSPLPFELETSPSPKQLRATKPQLPDDFYAERNTDEDYADMSDTIVRELLRHAMNDSRVDVFIQPVVRLPQRQTRFYEMFARIRARPGQYLPASRYMQIAEQDNLDGKIDDLLLLHCLKTLQESAHVQRAAPFFINIKNSTLTNMAFMKHLLSFLSRHRELAPRMVFEIRQSDFDAMSPAMLDVLRGLGKLGVSFSLDHVENLKIDVADLQHFKIRFVKVSAKHLLTSLAQAKSFADTHKAKRKLEANGIGVIIEKIENEEQMRGILDYDVHYGQGYLFGKPELEGAYKSRERARRMGLDEDAA